MTKTTTKPIANLTTDDVLFETINGRLLRLGRFIRNDATPIHPWEIVRLREGTTRVTFRADGGEAYIIRDASAAVEVAR